MSDTKHTPGPWFAIEYSGYWSIQSEEGYSENNVLDIEKDPNAEANAKLIAASPELLEVLMMINDSLDKFPMPTLTRNSMAHEHIKSVIKKATV